MQDFSKPSLNTAQNTVISPDFLLLKLCEITVKTISIINN